MTRKILLLLSIFSLTTLLPVHLAQGQSPESPKQITLKLVGGEVVTGVVVGIGDGNVNVNTDLGAIRVPIDRLTQESKAVLDIRPEFEVTELRKKVAALETLVAALREENGNLRKAGIAGAGTGSALLPNLPEQAGIVDLKPNDKSSSLGVSYRLSSTGKRHNSRCRFFGSKGRDCNATEGVACKVCGG